MLLDYHSDIVAHISLLIYGKIYRITNNENFLVCQHEQLMIFKIISRLAKAVEDLQKIIDNELDLKETEEFAAAVAVLTDAKDHLPIAEV